MNAGHFCNIRGIKMPKTILKVEWRQAAELVFEDPSEISAFCADPKLYLEFDIDQCNDENENIHVNFLDKFPIQLEIVKDFSLSRDADDVSISISYMLSVEIDEGKGEDDFDEWAYEESGAYCIRADTDEYSLEFGDGETYLGTKDAYGFSWNE
jgi:hypothetical protein